MFFCFQLETELKKEYETLASLTERYNQFIDIFKLYNCQLKDETTNIKLSSTITTETERFNQI